MIRRRDAWLRFAIKPLVFGLCLAPFLWLVWGVFYDGLGPNPVEAITHRTGDWTLRLLLVTLAVTPLRRLSGWYLPLRLRRMLGLFAFFYAVLHFLTWIWLDQGFQWSAAVADVVKRPYITLGFSALLMLVPLAVTSTRGWMRRLGVNWKRLHRLIYVIAGAGVVHYLWLVKADYLEPALYGLALGVLLAARLRRPWFLTRPSAAARAVQRPRVTP
jgi:sulfoxide reductase heme-binding subunit YedZ